MTSARKTIRSAIPPDPSWTRWITHAAFLLALALMIARLTTPDVLRDPWDPSPGGKPTPAGPGPGTGMVFDLLACLPAVLVLIRRAIDRQFRLVYRLSYVPLFALTSLAMLSAFWSADRFAAVVTASHFFAGGCMLWAMSQLVRSAGRFRLVSAVTFGLLLVLVAQSAMYRFIDVPDNIAYWSEHKADTLKERGWSPDSFAAKQFEHKLISGEVVGFFVSPNSFAAVGVLLFAACVGIGIQKLVDGEPAGWLAIPIAAAISLVWILWNAKSKTAAATPFLGLAILCLFAVCRDRLRRHHMAAYIGSVVFVVFGMIAVLGRGMYYHGLFPGHFSNSLDFRWKYWVASLGVFKSHPWIGVGWGNFGLYYLAHRLPEAAEEIKDPHNFLVRFFVELGLLGGALCIAWLLRLAWEITQPSNADAKEKNTDGQPPAIRSAVIVVMLGMLLSILANSDFNQPLPDILALLMKPILYLLAMLLGTMGGAMLSPRVWSLDDRPAPWIFYCTLAGLAMFLLHNLIDFSWFEAGAMILFMGLLGSSLGLAPAKDSAPVGQPLAIAGGVCSLLIWMLAAAFLVAPILVGESFALTANESIRTASADNPVPNFQSAIRDLQTASSWVPYNADYVFRRAKTTIRLGDAPAAESLINIAKSINPMDISTCELDANLQLASRNPDRAGVRADFEKIIQLNPNDVSMHVQYGFALERLGDAPAARRQYQLALAANDALPIGEPKRLSPDQLAQLQQKVQSK